MHTQKLIFSFVRINKSNVNGDVKYGCTCDALNYIYIYIYIEQPSSL